MTKPVRWLLVGVILLIIIGMIVYPKLKQNLSSDKGEAPVAAQAPSMRQAPLVINAVVRT